MTVTAPVSLLSSIVDGLDEELARWGVPGLELAVVNNGETVLAGGFGLADVTAGTPVTSSTLFDHGSCGKAFTSLLAVLLADDGVLDLDAPVRTYVPELRLPDPVVAERVTVRDLLSHRGGLDRHDHAWIYNPSWSREECVRRMAHLPLAGDLRAQWQYSNFGYTLAGLAIERATGSTWEDLLTKRVLEAAGMTRSTASLDTMLADPDHALPYRVVDGQPVETEFRRMPATEPAGGVNTCAEDSVRWLNVQLGRGPISADLVRRTQHPQVAIPEMPFPFPEVRLYGYGLGWVVATYRGRHALWHTGGVDGFFTYTLLLPDQGIGAVSCANRLDTALPQAVVYDAVDELLGERGDERWVDRMYAEAVPPPAPRPRAAEAAPPAHALGAYAGLFSNAGYGDLLASVVDGRLSVRLGEFDQETQHRQFETWDLHYVALDNEATVSFFTGADGVVSEAVVQLDGASAPIRFVRVVGEELT